MGKWVIVKRNVGVVAEMAKPIDVHRRTSNVGIGLEKAKYPISENAGA